VIQTSGFATIIRIFGASTAGRLEDLLHYSAVKPHIYCQGTRETQQGLP
jgi:hypothetical protein